MPVFWLALWPLWRGTTSRFAVRQNFCRGRMQNHIADHADQLWMRACRSGADHLHTKLITQRSRFRIKVIENFHVIGNKSDGTDNHAAYAGGMLLAEIIANIGRKPRLSRRAAAALVNQRPVAHAASGGHTRAGFLELPQVRRRFCHAQRNAVRGKDELLGAVAIHSSRYERDPS